jgi:hypothetical protein
MPWINNFLLGAVDSIEIFLNKHWIALLSEIKEIALNSDIKQSRSKKIKQKRWNYQKLRVYLQLKSNSRTWKSELNRRQVKILSLRSLKLYSISQRSSKQDNHSRVSVASISSYEWSRVRKKGSGNSIRWRAHTSNACFTTQFERLKQPITDWSLLIENK